LDAIDVAHSLQTRWACLEFVQTEPCSLRIEETVFHDCASLRSVFLPARLGFLHGSAFSRIRVIDLQVSLDNRRSRRFSSFLIDTKGASIIRYLGDAPEVVIPNFVEVMGPCSFERSESVTRLVFEFESKVRLMDCMAFHSCEWLAHICIPSSVEMIGVHCFGSCRRLCIATFGSNSKLKEFAEGAFADCHELKVICIPASVEVIGPYCFARCRSLCDLTFGTESRLGRLGKSAFLRCSSLTSICIPTSVDVIEALCFDQCPSLEHVTFEAGSRTPLPVRWTYTSVPTRRCCDWILGHRLASSLWVLFIEMTVIVLSVLEFCLCKWWL
jgi:hypothetical protein